LKNMTTIEETRMTPHHYFLWIRDNKGEDGGNIVLVNGYEAEQRNEAFIALRMLQSVCDSTCTAWLEVDSTLAQSNEDVADEIAGA